MGGRKAEGKRKGFKKTNKKYVIRNDKKQIIKSEPDSKRKKEEG